ncbi:MAG: phosphoglucomutase/phosphomannomutase family protein, partial [Hydrogenothermus sp.]
FGTAYYLREDIKVNGDEGRILVSKMKENPPKEFAGQKIKEVDLTDGVKLIFDDDSWILFRASGTEPVLRIYVETPEKDKTRQFLETAKELIK